MLQYGWPGNIRELRNCLQLAAGLSQNGVVSEACVHFMQPLNQAAVVEATVAATPERKPCLNSLAELEADFINSLIVKYQGNRKLIAAEMNISERTLYRKLNRLNLN